MDRELLDFNVAVGANGDNGGLKTLGDDHSAGTLGVLLGESSKLLSDLNNVLSAPLVAGRVGTSLGLVAKSVVSVRQDTIELVLEELGDEGGREVKHEDLKVVRKDSIHRQIL